MDMTELAQRVHKLTGSGASLDKMAKYLNAEFEGCFYVVRNALRVIYQRNGKQEEMTLRVE